MLANGYELFNFVFAIGGRIGMHLPAKMVVPELGLIVAARSRAIERFGEEWEQ